MVLLRKIVTKPLGEILVERGVISRSNFKEVLEYQKKHHLLFGEALVEMKLAAEEDVVAALTCQYGFAYLPLHHYEIAPEVLKIIPSDICKQYNLIPIDKIGKVLTLAMGNPLNRQAQEAIESMTGCSVQAFVSTSTDIKKAIKRYY